MPAFPVVNEFAECHRFSIRPDDIQLSGDSVQGGFGKAEVEESAGKLIRFFQSRGHWCSFTLDELYRYYREKGWSTHSVFFGLTGLWYNDAALGFGWKESWPCIATDASGLHFVTDQFILRCAGNAPLKCTAAVPVTHDPVEETLTDPESKLEFVRTSCSTCQQWLGDRLA